ncbi:MAG TPA: LPS export ABC transporter ATP-binding protein [Chitinophagaceae bacterium]|nr:LPS export ABC transporter ATP-binding protein [Chitinophagaceae bacterium]
MANHNSPIFVCKSILHLTIHTKDLVKSYRNRTVVNHVSVEVSQGEIVGLLGPNGAGKTTTFYMVVGLIKPDEGKVFLNEDDITTMAMYKRSQLGIGYLPQEASVFRKLTVEDNIKAVLEMRKLTRKEQKAKLEELLDEFHLHHVRKNNGDSLSGGERRRTEIARALAVDPKFILLDEPFAGVDPIAVEDIQAVVARLKYRNIGILITDHNVNETLSICDRAYLLIEGKIFKHGSAEELASDEHVRRLYLGRNFELKRKDYLLDEGRNQGPAKAQQIIRLVENVLSMYDQMAPEEKEKALSMEYGAASSGDNLPLYHFSKDLTELQETVVGYARETQNEELRLIAENLTSENSKVVTNLQAIVSVLKRKYNAAPVSY